MLSVVNIPERLPPISLGYRRGVPELAHFAIDTKQPAGEAERAFLARTSTYPSPPMSGSPHLPPKGPQEANERGLVQGLYLNTSSEDVQRGSLPYPVDARDQLSSPSSTAQVYPQEQPGTMGYPYRRPEHSLPRITTLAQSQMPHGLQHGANPPMFPGPPGPSNTPSYSVANQQPGVDTQPATSPSSQRKTKGHVASACVPCKRAHLRCDAQRPCSRCLSNGKEDSCVDVKHKKRGRPRLRDDREARYDPSRFPHPQDVPTRRPLNIYPSGNPVSSEYGHQTRRNSLHRVLKLDQSEAMTPRFLERPSASDPNIYSGPRPIASRLPPEAVAYLTLDLEFSKISPTFLDALGGVNITGRNLGDVVAPNDAERVENIQKMVLNEQRRREPNYLPPILGRGDQIIQALGYSTEDIARFQIDHQDYLTFIADGHARPHHIRFGLVEEGSFYFVAMILNFRHPSNVTPVYDTDRHRTETGLPPRQVTTIMNSSFSSGTPHYIAAPIRPSYSNTVSNMATTMQHPPPSSFQLPPIRAQQGFPNPLLGHDQRRTERSGRVDIEGLIDKPVGPEVPR